MKRKYVFTTVVFVAVALLLFGLSTTADQRRKIHVSLVGFQEVPAVSSRGSGEVVLRLNDTSIDFELSYEDLEGTVTQSHLHLGQRSVNGGIVVFLCTNLGNAPAGTAIPACPGPNSGSVSGTRTAADVVGVTAQGIAAGEFAEILRGIRSGNVYVNVHTTKHAPGEIRGQVRINHEGDDH